MSLQGKRINRKEERRIISRAARKASSTAVRVSSALKLPIQFVKGGEIVMQVADGEISTIKKVPQVKSRIVLTKGTKICLQQRD